MRLVSRCPLKTTVSFEGVNSNVKHVALCYEALKNSVNHNNTEDFPFINMLVKYTPVTGCPVLWCPGTMLKKKKFYIVCFIEYVLSMKKIKEKAFVIKKQQEIFLKFFYL